jgi:hypothetical protein
MSSLMILGTSAELELMKEMRTAEYLKTINWLKDNVPQYKTVFLECVTKSDSFIEDYFPVVYSACHDPRYINQGSNHGRALKKFFELYEPEEDIIVQTTGRYHFTSTHFFDTIEKNPGYDFYSKDMGEGNYFTGCFAMKKEYMIRWVNETDWDELNYRMINFETSVRNFVVNNKLKMYNFDTIHMDCNVFGKGNPQRGYV